MTNKTLPTLVSGTQIHRRDVVKSDGRKLYLYGYQPHNLPIMEGEQPEQVQGSELRFHPLRQTWAVYAAGRNKRTFKPGAASDPLAPTVSNIQHTEIPFTDFELCVFENRFPAFSSDAENRSPLPGLDTQAANGKCEVIVYAPDQTGSLASLGQERRRLILAAWSDRYENLYADNHAYVLPFENRGDAVGVTLHHPHGQIYALPIIPEPQRRAADAFAKGYDLSKEMKAWKEDYWIADAGGIVAFAPPFARFPYEVWLAPLDPVPGPWTFDEAQADGFAHLIGDITARYDAFFGTDTPFMFSLQAAPNGHEHSFQFTAQFYPLLRAPGRVKYFATLEQVTGVYTVDVLPRDAAATLRSVEGLS